MFLFGVLLWLGWGGGQGRRPVGGIHFYRSSPSLSHPQIQTDPCKTCVLLGDVWGPGRRNIHPAPITDLLLYVRHRDWVFLGAAYMPSFSFRHGAEESDRGDKIMVVSALSFSDLSSLADHVEQDNGVKTWVWEIRQTWFKSYFWNLWATWPWAIYLAILSLKQVKSFCKCQQRSLQ